MSVFANPATRPPLNPSLYSLDGDELAFFQEQTGIQDPAELKAHILNVQAKAYEIYGYPCIKRFAFTKLKISRLPAYKRALQLLQEWDDAILLDIGVAVVGNDIRKAAADGWPVKNLIASDLQQGFWDYGHELFRSTPTTFPVQFIAGDAFDPAIIAPRAPFTTAPDAPTPALATLDSLTLLQGHIAAIHASSFFHLFNEERQHTLAERLATLLAPRPGSMIFGLHGGRSEKGYHTEVVSGANVSMFCHSPETWKELWHGVFGAGVVRIEATLLDVEREGIVKQIMVWSVTRI
ncbi:hypothetical protein BD779DRAFT_1727596 [Infundibulicybe gibba]|nr:hypothetical protein BD779DRAFT_1727596 [Infundibulicybe gibba]